MVDVFSRFNFLKNHPIRILFIVFCLTYVITPVIFFQQDEWLSFGLITGYGQDLFFKRFPNEQISHVVPLTRILEDVLFRIFDLNSIGYNLLGLLIHFINGYLVYKIALRVFNSKIYSLVTALFFIITSSAGELVMWPVVSINMLSLTFSLLAFMVLQQYNGKKSLLFGTLSGSLLILSFLVIEYGGFLILLIPISLFILKNKFSLKEKVLFLTPFFLFNGIYLLFRFWDNLALKTTTVSSQTSGFNFDFLNLLKLPILFIGQLFMPYISYKIVQKILEFHVNYFEIIVFSFSVFVIFLLSWTYLNLKKLEDNKKILTKKYFIIFSLFALLSSLPFLFVVSRLESVFPGRYYYFGIVSKAFLYTILLLVLHTIWSKKRYGNLIIGILLILGFVSNWQREIKLLGEGKIRQDILGRIKKDNPNLAQKRVFYTESSKSFYGLPAEVKIMPFQSGFGQTLLVWYHKEDLPKEFYKDRFLWEIESQGYKEVGNKGFGYFRDFGELQNSFKKYKFPLDSIVAYKFESDTNKLSNISNEVREKLKKY